MKYFCNFPNCNFVTNERSLIAKHHIVPREIDNTKKNKCTLNLCPTCHNKIYVRESKKGIHSKLKEESLIIKHKLKYGNGEVICYINPHTNEEFLYDPVKRIVI